MQRSLLAVAVLAGLFGPAESRAAADNAPRAGDTRRDSRQPGVNAADSRADDRPGEDPDGGRSVLGAYLGVATVTAPDVLRRQVDLPQGVGLVVLFVDGPAAKAGLEQHDLLHKLNDQVLVNPEQLAVLVRTFKPTDSIELTVIRQGKPQKISVQLTEKLLRPLEDVLQDMDAPMERPFHAPTDVRDLPVPPRPDRRPGDVRPPPPAADLIDDKFTLSWYDSQFSIHLQSEQGKKRLTAKDKQEKVVFDGPIDTAEQLSKVPPEIRVRMSEMSVPGLREALRAEAASTRPATRPADPSAASTPQQPPAPSPVTPGP